MVQNKDIIIVIVYCLVILLPEISGNSDQCGNICFSCRSRDLTFTNDGALLLMMTTISIIISSSECWSLIGWNRVTWPAL